MRVYLDHGATTPVDPQVIAAMSPYFTQECGNASSLHSWGRKAEKALEDARKQVADSMNASPEEIVFTSGGSESDNLAIKGLAHAKENRGGHIITSQIEHPAVLETCRELEQAGYGLTYLGVDREGFVDTSKLKEAFRDDTFLVSIMHANNEIGTLQDITGLGKVCRDQGVIFHTDAVQSYTKAGFDVVESDIGMASFSAHKIHGPKGVGALYVRKDIQGKLAKQISGGHHEHDLRAGTENVAGAVGFAKAASMANEGHRKHMTKLRDHLINGLLEIPDAQLNGPTGERRVCNNANISFKHIEGESILMKLDAKGIAVSTGSACSSKSLMPSHVLTAIGKKPEESHGSIRFSHGRDNTQEEIDYVIESTKQAVAELRKMSPFGNG